MTDQNSNDAISFDLPKNQSSVIKVFGVGGGGSNAVNHMFGMGIKGVDFVICNTDAQALNNSSIPNKIQLGVTLTEGLGAGANPEIGQQAALENIEEIKSILQSSTKMVFITAGMGGGTGTGAAPVIARAARDLGILTVGIVTMPFVFEGNNRRTQAEKGIEALRQNVDSLIVINNNKLREVYGNLGFKAGFAKADEVLATAARGIAEVITHHYTTNIDLRDAKTVLANSGTAIMGSSTASGENRASEAITKALDSPLLNDNHIRGAKNVLLLIVSGKEEITIDEIGEINDHIQAEAGGDANIIMGIGEDTGLQDDIAITIVATGFTADQQVQVIGREPQKVIHTLEDEQAVSTSVYDKPVQQEEEEEDNIIYRELDRAKKEEEEKDDAQPQPELFYFEESNNDNIPLQKEEPAAEVHAEEIKKFNLEEDVDDNTVTNSETKEIEDSLAEETEDEPLFEISAEEPQEETEWEVTSEKEKASESVQSQTEEKRKQTPAEKTVYTLEDYKKLEEQLNKAQPENIKEEPEKNQNEAIDDEALQFEVKRIPENQKDDNNDPEEPRSISPIDSPIEESMRLKAEERRAQLKAFNHRFKTHPFSVNEVESEPAYKRQGLKIDEERYSAESKVSRFSIDNDENGNNIKTDNSFLHDNVD